MEYSLPGTLSTLTFLAVHIFKFCNFENIMIANCHLETKAFNLFFKMNFNMCSSIKDTLETEVKNHHFCHFFFFLNRLKYLEKIYGLYCYFQVQLL